MITRNKGYDRGSAVSLNPTYVPYHATVELTSRCNLECSHCYWPPGRHEELSTGELREVIDQLAGCGTLELTFTGGEPLVRHDFLELAGHARSRHMAVSLVTNGFLLDQSMAEHLATLNCFFVAVSVYGPTTHDQITGHTGSFDRAVRALEFLAAEGIRTQVKCPLMQPNAHEVQATYELSLRLGAEFLPNPAIVPRLDGHRAPLHYRMTYQQITDFVRWEAQHRLFKPGVSGACNAGRGMLSIGPDGLVYPCVSWRDAAGNVRYQGIKEIWDTSQLLMRLRRLEACDFSSCSSCHALSYCHRCPGQAWEEHGDFLGPHRESCRIADIRRSVYEKTVPGI